MLQDTHINAAQTLLKGQFPAVEGLESSLLIQTQRGFSCRVDETTLHVQIHYLPSHAHWVTSARLPKAINLLVFDSKRGPTLSTALEQQLCQIHCPIEDSIDVLIPNLQQQQKGSNNCGLFAIVYATELCWHGEVAKEFEEKGMRKHLLKCLQEGLLSPFPGKTCKVIQNLYMCTANAECQTTLMKIWCSVKSVTNGFTLNVSKYKMGTSVLMMKSGFVLNVKAAIYQVCWKTFVKCLTIMFSITILKMINNCLYLTSLLKI